MSEINGVTQVIHNPLDLPPEVFNEGMDRRETNRNALLHWLRSFKGKPEIEVIKNKKVLSKSGAEKILVKLGLKPTFPNLHKYEEAGSSGVEIENIVLECQIITSDDYVVGHGVGCRLVSDERGDINKAFKMAKKSAMIDATLTCCGLSDVFTQDLEDMQKDGRLLGLVWSEESRKKEIGFGKNKKSLWSDVDLDYVQFFIDKGEKSDVVEFCKAEKEFRSNESRSEQAKQDEINEGKKATTLGSKVEKLPKKSATPIELYTKPQIIDFIIKVGKKVSDYNEYRSHCIGDRSLESLKKDELVSFYKDLRDRL